MAVIEFHIHVDKDTTVNYSLMRIGIVASSCHFELVACKSKYNNICVYIYVYINIYVSAYALPIVIDF